MQKQKPKQLSRLQLEQPEVFSVDFHPTDPQVGAHRFVDPCEIVFRPLAGEFLGSLLLDFFASQILVFASQSLTSTALCTAAVRFVLMLTFEDFCDGEFNPAITLGKLFCLQRGVLLSLVLIGGQFFGAFLGEVLFVAVRPLTTQVFPLVLINDSTAFEDRLPTSFQSYFLIEIISTLLIVFVFLRTERPSCMAAVTLITTTLAFNSGLETRTAGNFAQVVSHSLLASLQHAPDPWRFVEAAAAAAFVSPLIVAVLFWLLNFTRETTDEDIQVAT